MSGDPTQGRSGARNEGEGDPESAECNNEATREFVESGKVEPEK